MFSYPETSTLTLSRPMRQSQAVAKLGPHLGARPGGVAGAWLEAAADNFQLHYKK